MTYTTWSNGIEYLVHSRHEGDVIDIYAMDPSAGERGPLVADIEFDHSVQQVFVNAFADGESKSIEVPVSLFYLPSDAVVSWVIDQLFNN